MTDANDNLPQLPTAFEKALLAYLKGTYLKKGRPDAPWNERDTAYFARGIVELNRSFTQTRSEKAFNYFNDPILRSGYLAYFLPVNAMKAFAVLSRYHKPDVSKRNMRVADIGAGPLTMTFGLLFLIVQALEKDPDTRVEMTVDAFEQNKKILTDGRILLERYLREVGLGDRLVVRVREHVGPFRPRWRQDNGYDYLLLGNVLNEFEEREDQKNLVMNILESLSKPGTVALFLEPGSKKFTRDLQHVRDEIIANTGYRALAPCLHQYTCPLNLTAKSDWCNSSQRWEAPAFIRDFDELTDLKKTYLLYSYLLLVNDERAVPEQTKEDFVSISDLMKEKGRLEVVGCGPAGRVRFIRSNRDASPENAAFDKIRRGTRFRVEEYPKEEGYVLNKNVSVKPKMKVSLTK